MSNLDRQQLNKVALPDCVWVLRLVKDPLPGLEISGRADPADPAIAGAMAPGNATLREQVGFGLEPMAAELDAGIGGIMEAKNRLGCLRGVCLGLGIVSMSISATTIVVDSVNDGAPGSMGTQCTLRSALAASHQAEPVDGCAAGTGSGDQIAFASNLAGTTVVLTEGQLVISTGLEVHGPIAGSPHGLTIDANSQSRVVNVRGGDNIGESIEVRLSSMTLTGGQTSAYGAAIHTDANWSDLILDDVHIVDNTSTAGWGGGISSVLGTLLLNRVVMAGNSAFGAGGAIYVNGTNVQINDSSLIGNSTSSADGGGALALQFNSTTIVNSTISGNIASHGSSAGGGIAVLSVAGVSLVHSTVAFNQAGTAGQAILLPSGTTFSATNSLIVQAGGEEAACFGELPFNSFNSLATDASCFGAGSAATPAAISLQPLADNGGPTPTHGLISNSIAVNGVADCIDQPELALDQRGQPRPAEGSTGNACDVGAFEFQNPAMKLTPQTVRFGAVIIGQAAVPLELNVAVQGDDAVIVSDISGLADPFDLHSVSDCMDGLQFIVQPGASCTVQIGFTPSVIGTFQQQPVLLSNAVSGNVFQVEGRGVESDEIFTDRFDND